MSNYIPGKRKLFRKVVPHELLASKINAGYEIGKGMAPPELPAMPEIPAAPTIDDAQKNRNQQDRLRRRRGVLANIYAGASGGGAKATLGG